MSTFINRQRGAGTCGACWDHRLRQGGALTVCRIQGYDQEEFTHLAVAAGVASGAADCGMGILVVRARFDLDFVPLDIERDHLFHPVPGLRRPISWPRCWTLLGPEFAARC